MKALAQGREEGKTAVDRLKRELVACRLHVLLPLRDSEVQEIRMSIHFHLICGNGHAKSFIKRLD